MSGHRDSHVATIQALMIPSAFFLSTRSHHWALESWLNAHVQFGVGFRRLVFQVLFEVYANRRLDRRWGPHW